MRIALIADAFPPLRSSAAVQLRDLSRELMRQGHAVTVLTPASAQRKPWMIEDWEGVRIVRLRAWKMKDVGYVRRTLGELLMPYHLLRNFNASPVAAQPFDGVVWYSPSIFLGPIVKALKLKNNCQSYLILRDIFPEWAADMGLMRRGPTYHMLRAVAGYQYSTADIIGVQSPGNLAYFCERARQGRQVEVLQNWLSRPIEGPCSIDISATPLAGRAILVYAGNMGVAQGAGRLLGLVQALSEDRRIGFVFVGRGSDANILRDAATRRKLDNVLFFDEIDPDEIPGLYAQCSIGLVTLDPRHRTHNIPGKFISYIHAGLPVLAMINPGNDLASIIAEERVGWVSTDASANVEDLRQRVLALVDEVTASKELGDRCRALSARLFSDEAAARQIVQGLQR